MTKKNQLILAQLTGFTPVALRGSVPEEPFTDDELKAFACSLTPSEMTRIMQGPGGANFSRAVNECLLRVAERDKTIRKPSFGRVASTGAISDWNAEEVLRSNSTTDPAKVRKDKK